MNTEFLIGCNYWASNAGTEMWRQWDPAAIRKDLRVLSENGISCLRVFPNWRDFQPVVPVYGGGGVVREYRMADGSKPQNPCYLDEMMLARFAEFCDICDAFGIRLIVGLITGYMSGQTYLPQALYGRPLLTDPLALLMQQRLVRGFVSRFKERDTIYAWDLGNECNNLGGATSIADATNWSTTIANAIRAADSTRPIISGMHGLVPGSDQNNHWTIGGQAEACDILTTHPYPYWVPYADQDPIGSMRTALHATFETKFYADIGHRPCLVEELGTMGPMVCSDEAAADFMRVNLLSNHIHGARGVLWWCANEQDRLEHTPYTYQMCEVELGMRYADGTPKPVLTETGKIAKLLKSFDFELPPAAEDAVCVSTCEQAQWGVAYITCCLAKQAGLNLRYANGEDTLPDAAVYLLPSITGGSVIGKENYRRLLDRIRNGATLYISNDKGILSGFEELVGLKVLDSCAGTVGELQLDGITLPFCRNRELRTAPTTATVLATDNTGYPAITANRYGKGTVIYANFPLEAMLLRENEFTQGAYYHLYRTVFAHVLAEKEVTTPNPFVGLTRHPAADGSIVCAAVNYSDKPQAPEFVLKDDYVIETVLYGNTREIPPFDACFFRIRPVE